MKIFLIDEHQTYREAMRIALWQEARIFVSAHGDAVRPMYGLIERQPPDLIVLDLNLRDTDAVSAVRELHRRGCAPRTLILTSQSNTAFVRDAFQAGTDGYAFKSQPLDEIMDAMRVTAAGQRYLSPQLPPLLAEVALGTPDPSAPVGLDRLSAREREVFCRIVQGSSSREIASALCISLKTVETHRLHINRKLGMHSPGQLIRYAALSGLMEI
jgi:two-component system, NarL family, response regulator NreC